MARVKLTGPDGRTAWLNVPENASEQDIQGAVTSAMDNWGSEQPKSMPWSDVPMTALKNVPKSAAEFGGNIAHAVTHPVETVKTLADVAYGGASKAAGALGVPMDPTAKAERERSFDAVKDFYADRYGNMEGLKQTIANDPVGVLADASAVVGGAGSLGARAPGVVGKASRAVRTAGNAVNPVTAAAKAIKLTGSKVVAPAVGVLTGAGAEPLRAAARAGYQGTRAFVDNMRGNAGINDTIEMAQSALGKVRQDRSAAYKQGMQNVHGQQVLINEQPMLQAVANARQKTHFNGVPYAEDASKVVADIEAKVAEFRNLPMNQYRTPEGMDALKRAIGEIRQSTQPGTLARNIADDVYNSIKSEISRQVPEYAKVMDDYSNASDKINDLQKTFSLGERAAPDTTARKLQSVMRNNVNTNYGRRTKLMDELAVHEPDLPAALAGQTLSSPTPRGLQALGATGAGIGGFTNPAALLALPFMSPRLMGEVAHAGGKGAAKVAAIAKKLHMSPERVSAILLGINQAEQVADAPLRGGSGPRYDESGKPRKNSFGVLSR
jgi:hypothetical protein